MLQSRRFNIVLKDRAAKLTKDLDPDSQKGTMVEYSGKAVTVKL